MIMNKLIQLKNIKKNYYTKEKEILAIGNVNLDIYEGEYMAIVGPSGCGKSTLLNIIGKIDDKTSGEVVTKDDIKIGYMLQNDCLFSWLNILDNCLLGLRINGELTKDNINYVKELLDAYGLSDFMYSYPSSLSGGMRQRVALIRTLALKPDILLLDEPFSALDYISKLKISNDLYEIIKNENIAVIMITHDIGEAISLSDRVIILTKRPARKKKEYEIKLNNKSNPIKNRNDELFSYYYDLLWGELDQDV